MKTPTHSKFLLVLLFLVLLASGCTSIGPSTVARDRFDYVVAISESVKRQMLLNLVKTRYLDAPVYMDIASVISQYAIEGELGFEFSPSLSDNNLLLGNGKYADRPTITYSPLTGEKYSARLLKPLPLTSIMLLLQSGYPVDDILRLCVQSINGIQNRRSGALVAREAEAQFEQIVELLSEMQEDGSLYFRLYAGESKTKVQLGLRRPKSSGGRRNEQRLIELLGLDPDKRQYSVIFGVEPQQDNEIAMHSRSVMQIMIELAAAMEVPEADVAQGRTMPTIQQRSDHFGGGFRPLIRIHHGLEQPDDPHAAVFYRDKWFWIEDTDLQSKSSLNFLMVLFSLTERGEDRARPPIVTVPAY